MSLLLNNRTFYDGEQGPAIMDSANFCSSIKDYLSAEQAALTKLLQEGGYRHAVEIGCDVARCFDVINSHGARYVGIDIRPEVVPQAEALFAQRQSSTARLIIGSADQLAEHMAMIGLPLSEPMLCILPFNLFGNIDKPDRILKSYNDVGVDVMMSNFLTTPRASQIRLNYYRKCGAIDIKSVNLSEGVVFTNHDNFYSMAYHPNVCINKLRAAGYRISSRFQDETSLILHAVARPEPFAQRSMRPCA